MDESRTQRTWRLLRLSWGVLREDRRLLVFPCVSAAAAVALGALCFVVSAHLVGSGAHVRRVVLIATLAASYPVTFASFFCGVALATVLARKLDGENVSVSDGWAVARERVGIIAGWTLLTCTVGALLRVVEEYVPLGGKIVAWLADATWSLVTLFAVPVLAYEGLGPRATFRRSAELFRRRWAEQTLGTVGIGAVAGVVVLPFVLLLGIGVITSGTTGVLLAAAGGGGLLGVVAVQTALDQVFRVFVYRNALGLDVNGPSGPFRASDLDRPFVPRKKWFGLS